jgi:hypothetical protein
MDERILRHKMVDIEADINDKTREAMLNVTNTYVKMVNKAKEARKTDLQSIRKDRKVAIKEATEKLFADAKATDENTVNEE